MSNPHKSTVAEIRERFDRDVDRFSNLATGQTATIDSALCLELVADAAAAATAPIRAVLDVGCGAGNYSLKLRDRAAGAAFALVDLSRPMLDRAAERLSPSQVALYQGDIRELEFPEQHFDVILAAAVLHHLRTPEEWERVFQSFYRWLRPGGGLWVFDLVTHESPALDRLLWERYGDYLTALGGPDYRAKVFDYVAREDTPTSLTYQLELARSVGFSATDVLHKRACFAAYGALR